MLQVLFTQYLNSPFPISAKCPLSQNEYLARRLSQVASFVLFQYARPLKRVEFLDRPRPENHLYTRKKRWFGMNNIYFVLGHVEAANVYIHICEKIYIVAVR